MSARSPFTRSIVSAQGRPNPGASVYFFARNTLTQMPVYSAATGGSALTQPLTPDADGKVAVWAPAGQYSVFEDQGGLTRYTDWDAYPALTEGWIAPTFVNSWVDVAGFGTAGYLITAEGVVHLRGRINGGTAHAFVLPVGYRPAIVTSCQTVSGTATQSGVSISTAGLVTPGTTGGSANLSLAGVHFSVS